MIYGYFDDDKREYVITRPDTPSPWLNYLGRGGFSSIISNTGGGLCFDGDPSYRRVTRYKFNNLPIDRPGRYLYIRDAETGDYWSPMWQPTLKPLDAYECRHGLGYTLITGARENVEVSVRYSIPLGARYELWDGVITNRGDSRRVIQLFTYVEWSWFDAERDILCDWPRMIFQCRFDRNKIVFDPVSEQCPSGLMRAFLSTDLPIDGHDCSLTAFIGPYRSETNPLAVEQGACTGSNIRSDNAVGVLSSTITLEPGESLPFHYVLGVCEKFEEMDGVIAHALLPETIKEGQRTLRQDWETYLSAQIVQTPDPDMNRMLNCWNAYQARTTFLWSRFISLYERGVDRGFGFRDSMQDVLGVMHAIPEEARQRILLLLSIQLQAGDARAVYYPANGLSKGGGRSDDHLWSVFSVCQYVRETGDEAFLHTLVPYVDGGEGTVMEHLERGLLFTRTHSGRHGFPDMRTCDWNDSLAPINERGGAESIFVFFQMAHGAYELIRLYTYYGYTDRLAPIQEIYDYCRSKLTEIWDGGWFIRAFTSEGEPYGTAADTWNRLFLNPQSWSVLSRLPSDEKANKAFDAVMEHLLTDWGLITHAPASDGYDLDHKMFFPFAAGSRENGGIFYHSNTWAIMALCLLKRPEDAWECYRRALPPLRNEHADLCRVEPYVYTQTMLGPQHEDFGKCSNSWLTGTASWMYFAATQYLLGIRPDYAGLLLEPCVPGDWQEFQVARLCRGRRLHIVFHRSDTAFPVIQLPSCRIEGPLLPWDVLHSFSRNDTIPVTVFIPRH